MCPVTWGSLRGQWSPGHHPALISCFPGLSGLLCLASLPGSVLRRPVRSPHNASWGKAIRWREPLDDTYCSHTRVKGHLSKWSLGALGDSGHSAPHSARLSILGDWPGRARSPGAGVSRCLECGQQTSGVISPGYWQHVSGDCEGKQCLAFNIHTAVLLQLLRRHCIS